jgi:hypothetical protein
MTLGSPNPSEEVWAIRPKKIKPGNVIQFKQPWRIDYRLGRRLTTGNFLNFLLTP